MLTEAELRDFVLGVALGDYDTPLRNASRLLRIAKQRGYVVTHKGCTTTGKERRHPVNLTPAGRAFIKKARGR